MPRLRSLLRRPSAPMLVALLALFVALGGPAQASRLINGKLLRKGSVTSRQIRDHSLQVRDLRKSAARKLRRTRNGSITESKIHNGAVTPGKLANGAVGSAAIADRSVRSGDIAAGAVGGFEVADASLTGADVADGMLDARDVGRFWGRFNVTVGPVAAHSCWAKEPLTLAPERANADISHDLVLVTPGATWPDQALTVTVHASHDPRHFVLVACNGTNSPVAAVPVDFTYLVVHVP